MLLLLATCSGHACSPGQNSRPVWGLELDWAVGGAEERATFSNILDIEITQDGNVVVLEFNSAQLRVLDADGSEGWTIGRRGRGPGEFTTPASMGWKGDTLWVVDPGNNRVSLYRLAREHLHDISLATAPIYSPAFTPPRAGPLLRDGSLLSIAQVPTSSRAQHASGLRPILKVAADGTVLTRLLELDGLESRQTTIMLRAGLPLIFRNPLSDAPIIRTAADGRSIVVIRRDFAEPTYSVLRIDLQGDTLEHREVSYVPTRITPEMARTLFASLAESVSRSSNIPEAAVLESLVRADLPDVLPPVSALIAGNDGSVWIQRESMPDQAERWEILRADLLPLGELNAPAGFRIMRASSKHAWGVLTGPDDVQQIARFRIERK